MKSEMGGLRWETEVDHNAGRARLRGEGFCFGETRAHILQAGVGELRILVGRGPSIGVRAADQHTETLPED